MNTPPFQRRLSASEQDRLRRLLDWLHAEGSERMASHRIAGDMMRAREGFASAAVEGNTVTDFDQLCVQELIRRGASDDTVAALLTRDLTTPLPGSGA